MPTTAQTRRIVRLPARGPHYRRDLAAAVMAAEKRRDEIPKAERVETPPSAATAETATSATPTLEQQAAEQMHDLAAQLRTQGQLIEHMDVNDLQGLVIRCDRVRPDVGPIFDLIQAQGGNIQDARLNASAQELTVAAQTVGDKAKARLLELQPKADAAQIVTRWQRELDELGKLTDHFRPDTSSDELRNLIDRCMQDLQDIGDGGGAHPSQYDAAFREAALKLQKQASFVLWRAQLSLNGMVSSVSGVPNPVFVSLQTGRWMRDNIDWPALVRKSPADVAEFQLNTPRLCMPPAIFFQALETVLGRPLRQEEHVIATAPFDRNAASRQAQVRRQLHMEVERTTHHGGLYGRTTALLAGFLNTQKGGTSPVPSK